MTDPESCPRCESTDIEGLAIESPHGDAEQAVCNDCEHRWGDGYFDGAARPLPDGHADCGYCDGTGDLMGRSCRYCSGAGIVQTALLG